MQTDTVMETAPAAKKTGAPTGFHVIVPKAALARLLDKVVPVAARKAAMPHLECIVLETVGPRLRVGATDLYQFADGTIEAEVVHAGAVAVNAKKLEERVAAMHEGPLLLSMEGEQFSIWNVGNKRRFLVPAMPGSEMPRFPRVAAAEPTVRLPAIVLKRCIDAVIASVSDDQTRPHVNSALVESDTQLRFVSTDGHRLQRYEIPLPAGSRAVPTGTLIPKSALHILSKIAGAADKAAEAVVTFEGPHVFVEMAGVIFGVKLIDAPFPLWRQVVPTQAARGVTANREKLGVIAAGVAIAAGTGRGLRLHLNRDHLRIAADSPESGDGSDEMEVGYTGPALTIGINARLLGEMLAGFETEDVTLGVSGELDPVILQPHGDTSYLGVLMPMRV